MKDNLYNPVPGKPGCNCGQPPAHPCPPPMPGCDCGQPPVPPQCPPPCPPPEFPPFCPEDKPMMGKPCCPPPPMPPAPSVVSGMDLYEAMNHLSDRVNICIHNYNQVMAENYKALRNMQRAAEENGAYYGPGEVWVEEGYYPDESATYHIVHKACVDRRGEPIRMQLHLAYGNTTNSKIEQNIFSASKVEYADKIMVAIPKGDKGWYGKALWHGCPMPSADEPTLWTVGFTRAGVMRVYGNSVNVDQMLRDTVEDAMGVSGVLVMDGKVTDDSYRQYIPNAEQQTSRVCMGQNMATREVVILTVGNENDVNKKGLTSKACAEILRQYGCDIAVELCEGVGSGAMDKGSLMYVPDDTEEPTAYAYWFISRKCFYKNDYERELAELVQNYGACIWGGFLNKKAIAQVKSELEEEIQRAKDAEQQLQENIDAEAKAREDADNVLQDNIDAEAKARADADKVLQGNIDAEAKARADADKVLQGNIDAEAKARADADKVLQGNIGAEAKARADADKVLQGNIDKEALARQNADAALQENINKEAQARQAADTVLQGNIDKETKARIAADTALGQRIDGLDTRLTAAEAEIVKINQLLTVLQQQMSSLDATVTELAKTISDIETSLNNLKQTVLALVSRVDELSTTVNNIISGAQDLPYVKRAGDTMSGALGLDYSRSGNISNFGAIALGASKPTGSLRPMIGVVGQQNSNGDGILELHGKNQVVVELGPDAETDSTRVATIDVGGADIISRIRVRDASWNAKGSIDATNNGLGISATGKQIAVSAGELKLNAPITSDIQVADDSKVVKGRLSDTTDGVALSAEDGACLKVGKNAVTVCDNTGDTSQIKGVKTGTENTDAVNVKQLRDAGSAYVKKSGDSMNGTLVFPDNRYINFSGPAQYGDGVVYLNCTSLNAPGLDNSKFQVGIVSRGEDASIGFTFTKGKLTAGRGNTLDKPCILGGIDTPVSEHDAVNKGYVDGLVTVSAPALSDLSALNLRLEIAGTPSIALKGRTPVRVPNERMVVLPFAGSGTAPGKGSGYISFEYEVDNSGFGWAPVYCSMGQASTWTGGAYIWHNAEINKRAVASKINVEIASNSDIPIAGNIYLKYLPLTTTEITP